MSRKAARSRRGLRLALRAVVLALGLWLAGLIWFVVASLTFAADRSAATDAIVVLTGGRLRLETGLDLLGAGKAKKLFVSGVNPRVDRTELERVTGPLPGIDSGRVTLGHAADNTLGNARETAQWMRQQRFASLRLVTSWYHMRRSLLEFARAMPEMRIVGDPVFGIPPEHASWAAWLDIALLTVGEYNKYLITLTLPGISEVLPAAPSLRPPVAETSR